MKNRVLSLVFALAVAGFWSVAASADSCCGTKAVTLAGDLTCGKCSLQQGDKCNDVLIVKDGDKEVQYQVVFTEATKGNHQCQGKKAVKVTGTVAEKDGKKVLTATKVEAAGAAA